VLRVTMQADAPYRMNEESLQRFYLPAGTTVATNNFAYSGDNANDGMVPCLRCCDPPGRWLRPRRRDSTDSRRQHQWRPARQELGEAMAEMERIVRQDLPPGFGFDWAVSRSRSCCPAEEAPMLFALSILVVFLCLAALYESWATPIAVLLWCLWASSARCRGEDCRHVERCVLQGRPHHDHRPIRKNAILIVEFALEEQKRGKPCSSRSSRPHVCGFVRFS
jgi:multidrug efflux pump